MMKTRHLLISAFVIMMATLAIISCKKRDPVTPDDQNVSSQVITALKDWHAKTTGVSYNTSKMTQSTGVVKKNALQPLWDKAKYKILASGERVIVVPAPEYALDNKDVQFSRFFVFTEINAKIENGNIVELYSKNGSLSKTIDIVTEFKESSISGFSGAVITYDLNYNYSGSNFYINGKKNTSATYVVKQQKVPVVAANKTKRIALTALNDEGGGGSGGTSDCTDYYWVVTYSDGSTDSTFLYRVCTGGSDPGNGTGPGGGGTTPPPPPVNNPCNEKASVGNQQSDYNLSSYRSSIISAVASSGTEYGVEMNLTSTTGNTFVGTSNIRGGSTNHFSPNFTWNATDGYTVGVIHGHPGGSAPSPADVVWAYGNLSNTQLTNAGYGDVAIYKARYSQTIVTASATYVITISDWGKLYAHKALYDSDPAAFNQNYINIATNHGFSSEYALLSIFGDAINLYKAPAGSTVFQPLLIDTSDKVANKPCP